MTNPVESVRRQFEKDFTVASLKATIIVWSLIIIGLALWINDKWVLAGILAYEVLP
jgi:hypothetical protein